MYIIDDKSWLIFHTICVYNIQEIRSFANRSTKFHVTDKYVSLPAAVLPDSSHYNVRRPYTIAVVDIGVLRDTP